MFIPDLSTNTAIWKAALVACRDPGDTGLRNMEAGAPASSRGRKSTLITLSRGLRVEVHLKVGGSWPFDFVGSIDTSHGASTVKIGLRMGVEPYCTVSSIAGIFDTVTLEAHHTSETAFAATFAVPPDYSLRVTDVEDVS
jgi:hypothetical protein